MLDGLRGPDNRIITPETRGLLLAKLQLNFFGKTLSPDDDKPWPKHYALGTKLAEKTYEEIRQLSPPYYHTFRSGLDELTPKKNAIHRDAYAIGWATVIKAYQLQLGLDFPRLLHTVTPTPEMIKVFSDVRMSDETYDITTVASYTPKFPAGQEELSKAAQIVADTTVYPISAHKVIISAVATTEAMGIIMSLDRANQKDMKNTDFTDEESERLESVKQRFAEAYFAPEDATYHPN
jgi:hypothetical protein